MYSLSSRTSCRVKIILNQISNSWDNYVNKKMSREKASRIRKQVVSENGSRTVDQKLKKHIKEYCRDAFGSSSYWPWLATYAELRGEFKQGWIPVDYYRFRLLPKMNPEKFMRFSEAKTIDHKLFNGSIITPLFFRSNGLYCDKDGVVQSKSDIQQLLHDLNDEIVIKPDDGRGGNHIMFKHSTEISLKELPPDTDLLFQKVVHQHHELDRLYPHSVNTFRVLTYIDQEGSIQIKFIIIRFGRSGSRVDNASNGGGWIFVQMSGKVEPMAYNRYGIEIGNRHPDTGVEYEKLELPFLLNVINLCKDAHRSFPYTRIIGWDVFIDQQKGPRLIEWNANNPGFWEYEARFGPFFREMIHLY